MSNSTTSNESEYSHPPCDCPACVCLRSFRAEAAARASECDFLTATQYLAREQAKIIDARAVSNAESERLRTFLKDCGCPCCAARSRLRTLSYDRAYGSLSSIHCASTDRRDHHPDSAIDEAIAASRDAADEARKAVRAPAPRYHETDTDAR